MKTGGFSVKSTLRRRIEEVDFWRASAGWSDDEEAMMEYNSGVYHKFYELDDDGSGSHRSGGGTFGMSQQNTEIAKNALKISAVVVSLGLMIMMYRTIMRRMGDGKKDKKKNSDSKARSRSRTKSRTRSRSRSRKAGVDGYDLMNDDDEARSTRSKRSTRTKSTKNSRSRSRTRSRSKSHDVPKKEAVLV